VSTTLRKALRMLASARSRAALSLGVVLAVGATGTFAYWTDAAALSGATFTAGTLNLKFTKVGSDVDNDNAYTSVNISNMVPGNSVAGLVVLKNAGTAPMKWTATSAATDADSKHLAAGLAVAVTTASSVSGNAPSQTCGGTTLSAASPSLNGPVVTTPQPATAGVGLAAGASQTVCVQVSLPSGAASTLQGATTDVVLTFTATSDIS